MKAAFYAGASGLQAQQEAMNIIGQNLANVNTTGYQPTQVSFSTLLNTEMYVNAPTEPRTGYGVKSVDAGVTIGAGSLQNTGRLLDFAVTGNGFFAVEHSGQTQYTRAGNFDITMDGDSAYLGTNDGGYVLDDSGSKVELEKEEDSESYALEKLIDEIGVYYFDNPEALGPISNNRYIETVLSGEARASDEAEKTILQGSIESSGTSMETEMAKLISVQRAFQISARVLQAADENEQTITGLRG